MIWSDNILQLSLTSASSWNSDATREGRRSVFISKSTAEKLQTMQLLLSSFPNRQSWHFGIEDLLADELINGTALIEGQSDVEAAKMIDWVTVCIEQSGVPIP